MPRLSFSEFDQLYVEQFERIFAHWTRGMQEEVARHCRAWSSDRFDFANYLRRSALRYYYAYECIERRGLNSRVCDVGGFFGAFPATLSRLGYDVTMTETLAYYGGAFDRLFSSIREAGVTIVDFDPFETSDGIDEKFDVVTAMAIIEHYPHSPKTLLDNVKAMTDTGGCIYVEVPNLAHWPSRWKLLRGYSPLAPIADVYHSEVPYIGHHREFTIHDLRELAELANLRVTSERFYNYSDQVPFLRRVWTSPLTSIMYLLVPTSRECIAVECRSR